MHLQTLAHSAFLLWVIGWAKSAAFGYALKKAWAMIKAVVALIHQIVALPAQLAVLLSELIEGLLKIVVTGLFGWSNLRLSS
jgi:Zn-dependent protease